ncbi:hypothetical protein D8I35_03820 [Corticibacter populi]|uniref:TonB-dependent receptor n=1 Tax=Corticibacter populi TaxID=1550736 RepID=A0A3M6QZ09_9BURK|nr:hypothetical protein [Corticibacter populi]RMX08247.1 hypothetical protein D8I35_03820 [Corticibacter populi]
MERSFSTISYTDDYIAARQMLDVSRVIAATDAGVYGNANLIDKTHIDAANTRTLPGPTLLGLGLGLGLGLRWRTDVAGRPPVLRGTVQNVTNKAYWAGSLGSGLGTPHTFVLPASMDF